VTRSLDRETAAYEEACEEVPQDRQPSFVSLFGRSTPLLPCKCKSYSVFFPCSLYGSRLGKSYSRSIVLFCSMLFPALPSLLSSYASLRKSHVMLPGRSCQLPWCLARIARCYPWRTPQSTEPRGAVLKF
jgi:hypothetical protein